jgi:hypothetical protein
MQAEAEVTSADVLDTEYFLGPPRTAVLHISNAF